MWLYHRFPLSCREVEELLLERGIIVSYERVRAWCATFGPTYATQLRRRQPRPGDKWHLDEVFIKVNGKMQYLWRAVDHDGNVLDILVQDRRDTAAARRFFRKLLKGLEYVPRVIVTDMADPQTSELRMDDLAHETRRFLRRRQRQSPHRPWPLSRPQHDHLGSQIVSTQ
ncbi:IS6 family transposase [Streptomyces sp. NPDC052043]|uniref:IS6 family transposase n=1 Tax=Streptomyces sp. NPDC052043 TaxID=3365684 RepID=UPI0037D275C5